jgi:hypothetical protein
MRTTRISQLAIVFAIAIAGAFAAPGCAPSELSAAREKIAAGQYGDARADLLVLAANGKSLTPDQRREVKDDLCVTDFMIGRPSFSFAEQRSSCTEALAEPGSQSAPILARIEAADIQFDTQRVDSALAEGDLAGAEDAALVYSQTPDADQALVAKWSRQMWALVSAENYTGQPARKAHLNPAISATSRDHPDMKGKDPDEFKQWIKQTATEDGEPFVSRITLGQQTLRLSVSRANLHAAALNLDKFAIINDAMAARCGCDARTDVALLETGFPVCLIRLDPEMQRSEVVILPHGLASPPTVSMR